MIKVDFKTALLVLTLVSTYYFWQRAQYNFKLAKQESTLPVVTPIIKENKSLAISDNKKSEPILIAPINSASILVEIEKIRPHLNRFHQLQVKVLRNLNEENELLVLLRNPTVLLWAEKILIHPESRFSDEKNKVLSLVIESMRSGEPAAGKVLSAFIADAGIENEAHPFIDRKFQAGLKAEAMFTWSSQDPEKTAHIESLLPGPISQKIWQNVLVQQNNNLAESELVL